MADQLTVVGDLDPAEPDSVARAQPVRVDALAGAGNPRRARQPLGHGEILRIGELEQHGVAGHEAHHPAGRLHHARFVGGGQVVAPGGVGGHERRGAERLGGLRPPQAFPGRGFDVAGHFTLDRIGHRQGEDRAVGAAETLEQGPYVFGVEEGACGVVHHDHLVGRPQRPEPRHHGLGPRVSAGGHDQAGQVAENLPGGIQLRGRHYGHHRLRTCSEERLDRPARHRLSGHQPPLFRHAGPGPRPRSGRHDDRCKIHAPVSYAH